MVLLLACVVDADPPVDTAEPADSGDVVDSAAPSLYDAAAIEVIERALTRDLRKNNASGVQVAVWHGGSLVYRTSAGTRHPDTDEPVDDLTLFQIGSDTKKIAAIAALQQVDAGTMSLDDTVAEVLPNVSLVASPEWAAAATLHDLLSHQGGLFDLTPWDDNPDDAYLRGLAEGELSERGWALAAPGSMWNYSNPNFSLAGLMTEAVTGRAWPDVVEDDVFAPLGLADSYARKAEVEGRGNYATGFGYVISGDDAFNLLDSPAYDFGTVEMTDVSDNAFTRPAGMVWSTASDMATFGAFFVHGDPNVLSDARRAEMTTMHTRLYPAWDAQGYGYGWFVVQGLTTGSGYFEVPVYVHGGNTLSFTSTTYVLPDQDLSFSILSNGYGDDFTGTVVELLEGSGLLPAAVAAPAAPDTETNHAELVGVYEEPTLGTIVVTDLAGTLTIEMPDAAALGLDYAPELEYAGFTDLYLASIGTGSLDFTFVADDSGTYAWMRNREFVATRSR